MKKKPLLPPATTSAVPELATEAHNGTPQYGDYRHLATKPVPKPAPYLLFRKPLRDEYS